VAKKEALEDFSVGDVVSEEPNALEDADDEEKPENQTVAENAGPRVPNFRGMTMRAVLAEAAAHGWNVMPNGSGVARVQNPPAGAMLHPGERIRVQFIR
jgi:hypothetical protein